MTEGKTSAGRNQKLPDKAAVNTYVFPPGHSLAFPHIRADRPLHSSTPLTGAWGTQNLAVSPLFECPSNKGWKEKMTLPEHWKVRLISREDSKKNTFIAAQLLPVHSKLTLPDKILVGQVRHQGKESGPKHKTQTKLVQSALYQN